jgi:hypothetical protein
MYVEKHPLSLQPGISFDSRGNCDQKRVKNEFLIPAIVAQMTQNSRFFFS